MIYTSSHSGAVSASEPADLVSKPPCGTGALTHTCPWPLASQLHTTCPCFAPAGGFFEHQGSTGTWMKLHAKLQLDPA